MATPGALDHGMGSSSRSNHLGTGEDVTTIPFARQRQAGLGVRSALTVWEQPRRRRPCPARSTTAWDLPRERPAQVTEEDDTTIPFARQRQAGPGVRSASTDWEQPRRRRPCLARSTTAWYLPCEHPGSGRGRMPFARQRTAGLGVRSASTVGEQPRMRRPY